MLVECFLSLKVRFPLVSERFHTLSVKLIHAPADLAIVQRTKIFLPANFTGATLTGWLSFFS